MESHLSSLTKSKTQFYQPKKLYIDNIKLRDEPLEDLEGELLQLLREYGKIIDIKIMQNSNLTRRR